MYRNHTILRYALLALFVAYYTDIGFFTHGHIVNGIAIVHSHFYKHNSDGADGKPLKHSHSGMELQLIFKLSHAQLTVDFSAPDIPSNPAPVIAEIGDYPVIHRHLIAAVRTPALRAPPFCLV